MCTFTFYTKKSARRQPFREFRVRERLKRGLLPLNLYLHSLSTLMVGSDVKIPLLPFDLLQRKTLLSFFKTKEK